MTTHVDPDKPPVVVGNGEKAARRSTVHDVARAAGVSLATVDRVLNARPGVREKTIERVNAAIAELGFSRDLSASLLARARGLRIAFLIPDGANEFMARLSEAVALAEATFAAERLDLDIIAVPALDAGAIARELGRLGSDNIDCAVVVALDDAPVRKAVEELSRRDVPVLTLVSDLPGSARRRFVGIDNIAAGRTAAALLGRFLPDGGKVALIAGSMGLSDHAQRHRGFAELCAERFAGLEIIGPLEAHDRDEETAEAVGRLLAEHADLAGIYCLGAGTGGLVRALGSAAGKVRVIAHELTPATRAGLTSGAIDVVLDQDPEAEIRAVLALARVLRTGGEPPLTEPIEIRIFLRENVAREEVRGQITG